MASPEVLALAIAIPLLVLFTVICSGFLIFKFCYNSESSSDGEDSARLLQNRDVTYDSVSLVEKVNLEKRQSLTRSKETAYVYLQFFFRSNPDKDYKLVEQLANIGSQVETERNWFLIRQNQIDSNNGSEYQRYKLIFINTFDSKLNKKRVKLSEIADSMSISTREMEILLDKFFKSIKHPHVLSYETVEVNFDKERVLFLQDYSRDGSLRDLMCKTDPKDKWQTKLASRSFTSLPIRTIKEYTKQILAGLIYLNEKIIIPIDTLHSGNVILAYKKRVCLITGVEDAILLNKTRLDKLNEKQSVRIVRSYLVKANENNEFVLRKAKNELELKYIVQVLRVGALIVEMCTGIECEEIIPDENVFEMIKRTYKLKDATELMSFLNYIYFNRNGNEEDKLKGKFQIPSLNEIYEHEFLKVVKLKEPVVDQAQAATQDIKEREFLDYLTGKLEIKIKKLRRKSTLAVSGFSKRLSSVKEPISELQEAENGKSSKASQQTMPPPPPPRPNGLLSPPPPPPPPPALQSTSSPNRSALLTDIRGGKQLKKTITNDRSKPIIS